VDIAPEFVKAIELRAKGQGIDNIVGIVNDQKSTRLPPQSVDLVFISDTYHHFEYPMTTMKSIHEALRPGGELVVIDFKRIPGFSSAWVMGHVRAGEEQVTTEIQSAGFELVQRLDFMQTQYFLRFRKR
jgi:predicted methyltransferase